MVELLHPLAVEPTAISEREPGSIEVHELHPCEVAIIRIEVPVADMPGAVGEAIGEVESRMAEAGVTVAGPPFTRYLAFGPMIVAEVGCPVLRPAPHVGRVYPGQLPGGRTASILHVGPYEGLEGTYAALQAWLDEVGATAAGPMREVYWTDPGAEPDPAGWRTEMLVPLG